MGTPVVPPLLKRERREIQLEQWATGVGGFGR